MRLNLRAQRVAVAAVAWLLAAAAPLATAAAPVQAFAASPRNLHGLVVERQGRLVAEAYREGADRST